MKMVVLDSFAAVSTDLSLDGLRACCGEFCAYDRTPPEETVSRIGDAELVIINKTVLSREILEKCEKVRYIGLFATGYNIVDVAYCRERGIVVSNVPGYSTDSVAELVFAYLLHFAHRAPEHDGRVHAGEWQNCPDFAFYNPRIFELAGKTLGIVGYGSIGRKVAQIAGAFGMKVLVHTRTVPSGVSEADFVSLDTLLAESDFVTLHCPLFPETAGMIGEAAIERMKDGAYLINTARGGLVDEAAAARALSTGKLAGMAADVVSAEPIRADNPLLGAKNCLLTPHIAWATREARERLIAQVCENVRAFLAGRPRNNVAQ